MVAVFSSKGGCGTSFIATNLAAATASKTVLVDLNLQAGDLPLFLGLEAKYSIADMVEKRQRLDEALINSLVTPHSTNLSLLAAPREADSRRRDRTATRIRSAAETARVITTTSCSIRSTRSTRSRWPRWISQTRSFWC